MIAFNDKQNPAFMLKPEKMRTQEAISTQFLFVMCATKLKTGYVQQPKTRLQQLQGQENSVKLVKFWLQKIKGAMLWLNQNDFGKITKIKYKRYSKKSIVLGTSYDNAAFESNVDYTLYKPTGEITNGANCI